MRLITFVCLSKEMRVHWINFGKRCFATVSRSLESTDKRDDMGHDAAVRAYSKLTSAGIKNFQFRSSFRSYCWTIISREMFRLMKKEFVLEELEPERYAAPEIEERTADAQTILNRIQSCLDLLKGNRLKVFELIDLGQKSPGDVAEALGLTRNNVNKLASRARLDMRRCLEGQGYLTVNDVIAT